MTSLSTCSVLKCWFIGKWAVKFENKLKFFVSPFHYYSSPFHCLHTPKNFMVLCLMGGKVQTLDWTRLLDWYSLVFNFISYILWYRVVLFYWKQMTFSSKKVFCFKLECKRRLMPMFTKYVSSIERRLANYCTCSDKILRSWICTHQLITPILTAAA